MFESWRHHKHFIQAHIQVNKCTLHSSVNVFSTKVLIGDILCTSLTEDETAISHSHLNHVKV